MLMFPDMFWPCPLSSSSCCCPYYNVPAAADRAALPSATMPFRHLWRCALGRFAYVRPQRAIRTSILVSYPRFARFRAPILRLRIRQNTARAMEQNGEKNSMYFSPLDALFFLRNGGCRSDPSPPFFITLFLPKLRPFLVDLENVGQTTSLGRSKCVSFQNTTP